MELSEESEREGCPRAAALAHGHTDGEEAAIRAGRSATANWPPSTSTGTAGISPGGAMADGVVTDEPRRPIRTAYFTTIVPIMY
jgi:hypothetical protein